MPETTRPQMYEQPAVRVAVMQVEGTKKSTEAAAAWCGGKAQSEAKPSDPTDVAYWVLVPCFNGNTVELVKAYLGNYIVRDERGRFRVWNQRAFEDAFRRSGLRGERGPETVSSR